MSTVRRTALLDQLSAARAELSALIGKPGSWLTLDLTMSQLRTLVYLAREQQTFVSDVAEMLGISRPAASIAVDRLVQLGLIGRQEDRADRRRTLVCLTPQGRELIDRLLNGPSSLCEATARLPMGDLAALAQGTAALVRQLRIDAQLELRSHSDPPERQAVAVGMAQ